MKTIQPRIADGNTSGKHTSPIGEQLNKWLLTKVSLLLVFGCIFDTGPVGKALAAKGGPTPNGLTILGAEANFASGALLI